MAADLHPYANSRDGSPGMGRNPSYQNLANDINQRRYNSIEVPQRHGNNINSRGGLNGMYGVMN